MPCGGIYPIGSKIHDDCFNCNKPLGDAELLFVEEWDAAIHKACLREFLVSPEAEVIREHQHPIITEMNSNEYVKLLCYSPELGMSDWALCTIDFIGNEIVLESWSRWEHRDEPRR